MEKDYSDDHRVAFCQVMYKFEKNLRVAYRHRICNATHDDRGRNYPAFFKWNEESFWKDDKGKEHYYIYVASDYLEETARNTEQNLFE